MKRWSPWKETEGLRVMPALRDSVSEIQNMGIRLMNCLECMRITPDFMEIAPSARNMLIARLGECLASDRMNLSRAFEMAIGYSQGILKISQMTVREAFVIPYAREYFLHLLISFEQNIDFIRIGHFIWRSLGSHLKAIFSISPFVLFLLVIFLSSFFKEKEVQFLILLGVVFLLSKWRFDRFHVPYTSLFPKNNTKDREIEGFLAYREERSFIFIFVQSCKFYEEESFLNFMTMFFHGQILCDERKNLRRKVFRMQFKKKRLSAQFVQDIMELVRGFFSFFLKMRGHKLICS